MSLVLTRNVATSVIIGEGDNEVRMTVVGVSRGQVRLSFEAPKHVIIDREETREKRENNWQEEGSY